MFFNTMAYHAKVLFLMGMDAKIFLCSVNQSKTLIRWSLTYSRKVGLNDFCIVLTVFFVIVYPVAISCIRSYPFMGFSFLEVLS